MSLSRRSFMPLLAGAVAAAALPALASKRARAQGDGWREFRRDDVGFQVEMPGEPKIEVKEDEYKDIWTRTIDAQVDYEQVLFGASCTEYKQAHAADEQFRLFRESMRLNGMPVTREIALTMNGFPAREFISETDHVNFIRREVVAGNLSIAVQATGDRGIHSSPTVRRFLNSFALLRSAR